MTDTQLSRFTWIPSPTAGAVHYTRRATHERGITGLRDSLDRNVHAQKGGVQSRCDTSGR